VPWLHRDRAANHLNDSDNLRAPGRDLSERTATYAYVRRTSLYTRAQMNPRATAAAITGVVAATALALLVRKRLEVAQIRREARHEERERRRRAEARRGT
jgi:hypothetical protein